MQIQTDNPKLKNSHCQTNSGKITDCWTNFLDFLSKKGQLSDFKNLAEGLMSGCIDSRNLSWISALHIGQYSTCKSTTGMRYDKEYMEFMSLLYLLYGSSVLNVLQGSTHFGSVVSGMCTKSLYDPSTSHVNFPVPDVRTLRKLDTGFPKETDPGVLINTLDICEEKALAGSQFCLSFDGL